ncbi:bifunctional prephenate dehydrogenase/3-phosphoshikimate 1-carboxyvinyltransferase [Simiduia agarivorans]|uniref:3-phosphoshikimate 1-carboxyvinyltransferase n=1 Tax=Simiduia agarivorans (strain DSM 21679 / JCM 13881 / BCRC 17597 / SA1) TaxID=1117647 RepID=K4KHS4_SIMAS|nr:bifunctional prephenate dehydrogenase/3-phosphoshikimate 1-carboxyvinyltransferase [Simiduia agarivorans]AFU97725.2 bifunctional cyclohexadienyl dehydrogenase/ 3-phosphoshikimate 1-carboxyvinyltransferase [Simiduia agarivorans SA1 = DSM 21679]
MNVVNTLVVVGLGLIGSSLAAGLKQRGRVGRVLGVARRTETLQEAQSMGIIDAGALSLSELSGELVPGDVVFISVPTLAVESVLDECKACLPAGIIITDGASVKGSVLDAARRVWGVVPPELVAGHPIAGSEKSGVSACNPDLYVNHRVILTPVEETSIGAHQKVTALWQAVEAEVLNMPVDLHDDVLAATSHLPHAIAYSLVDTLAHDSDNEDIFRYAAGGFRDFTRIASSDPVMWHDIMQANQASVLDAIDLFSANLGRLRKAIATDDSEYMLGVFTRAKEARDHFTRLINKQAFVPKMQSKEVTYVMQPGGQVNGQIRVPGDKSISHRSIMLGSLAEGVTEVEGFLEGEDALATLQAFRDMGVVIEGPNNGRVKIHGVGLHGLQKPAGPLYLGNSGTSMRLLAGILAGQPFDTVLTGDESLSKRPMNRVVKPLLSMGARIEAEGEKGFPPVKITGGQSLRAMDYTLPMASAQVKSCVLLAGLYADGETSVTEPAPTRDHTERMLRGFGYKVSSEGPKASLKGGSSLFATQIDVPADISSAAFFMVAASIAPGSDLTLTHVGINPTRIGIINILRLMGADITISNEREVGGEPVADIRVQHAPLKGIQIPEDQVPLAIDECPVLFVAAACAEGTTVLTGAEELRVKESDRIQCMADGLITLGIKAEPTPDGIVIEGGQLGQGTVESYGDHRIAMAFAVASLRSSGPITILNCANVGTSFPNFAELAQNVGIKLTTQAQ